MNTWCPECGTKIEVRLPLKWGAVSKTVQCPNCGCTLTVNLSYAKGERQAGPSEVK